MILIDLIPTQPLSETRQVYSGAGEYAKRIFKELLNRNPSADIGVVLNRNRGLDPEISEFLGGKDIPAVYVDRWGDLGGAVDGMEVSKLFLPLLRPIDLPEGINLVATLHDARLLDIRFGLRHSVYFQGIRRKLRFVLKRKVLRTVFDRRLKGEVGRFLARTNLDLVTVSEVSRCSIAKHFPGLPPSGVRVLYSPRKEVSGRCFNRHGEYGGYPGKFFLILSSERPEKNAVTALKAFDRLPDTAGYKLIVLGGRGGVLKKVIRHQDRFVFRNYVSTEELEFLYGNCAAFLFPSLNEGFGYPPLEAMRHGKTVFASNISSIPEICGNAVYYFAPLRSNQLKNLLSRFVSGELPPMDEEVVRARFEAVGERQDRDLQELVSLLLDNA